MKPRTKATAQSAINLNNIHAMYGSMARDYTSERGRTIH